MKKIYSNFTYLFLFAIILLMGCTKDIDIEDQFDFDFVITAQDEGFVYERTPFDIVIKPQRVVSGTSYELSFAIEKEESHLETKSPTTVIKPSEKYKMGEKLDHSLMYLPTAVGDNAIVVSIKDNHGVVKTKTFKYKSKYAPFTFLLTPNQNSYTINARGAMTSTLIRKEEDSFKFKYVVTGGTGIFYDGVTAIAPGEDYVLKNGVKQLHYVPSTLGLHKITSSATASDNAMVTRDIEVSVDNVPFTLSATAATTSVNVNQELSITVDLTELTRIENVTYDITHSFDPKGISGIMSNALGVPVVPGIPNPILPGKYQYKFKPSGKGQSTITFKVKDSNGQIKESIVVITVENVPFSFTSIPSEKTILLNRDTSLNFNLVPNATDSNGVTYKFLYQTIQGDGTLYTSEGSVIKPGTPIVISKGTFTYKYNPKTLGAHKLNFIVTDNNGEERTGTIEMNAIHTPVTFNVSSVTQTYVNQSVPVNFTITPQNAADLTYKMNYYVSGGEGNLENSGAVIMPGNYQDVNKGSFQYKFTPSVAGTYVLSFELKDSNGQMVSKDITLVVLNNKFSFTPTPSQNVFVNENNTFSYALVPTGNYQNTTYSVSYSVESGQLGSFYKDGTQVQQGIPITVIPTAFNLVYKPTTIGEHKIKYIVTDSNGLKEEIIQVVNVIASDFKFSTQQATSKIYKNKEDALILSISQEQINPNIKYTLTYSITGVGQLFNNGVALNKESIITPGNHNFTFVSNQSGNSKIDFVILDSNGVSHTQSVSYTVINADFTLSTTGDGTINLGKSKSINFYLSQLVPDDTASYQVRYLVESGSVGAGVIQKNGAEVPYSTYNDANLGSTALTFVGTQVGPINIKVEVKDSNGVIHTSTIAFNITEIGYTFSGASQNNSIFVTGSTSLNFDLTESSSSETQYEMKYSFIEGDGLIKNGNINEASGQFQTINIGSFNKTFVGTTVGTVKILFTVRNKTTLIEKTQAININVVPSEFTFNATATSNNEITKTPVNINLNLNQVGGGSDTYNLTFNTTGTGTFLYNGITYTAGQIIPFSTGSSNGRYTGTTGGDHNIIFTVANQDNKSKTASVNLKYINNDFTLSTSGDGSLNINANKNFNIFLAQNTNDSSINYEVKYSIASGTTGNGELTSNGSLISLGSYQNINKGSSQVNFKGTEEGTVNIEVTVKDSNGISHSSIVSFEVKGVIYAFSGAPQNNSIFVSGSTSLNFDITETAASGTLYEMKYTITEGNAEIKNGSKTLVANQYEAVNVGAFNRSIIGTTPGSVKVMFTVRNTATLVEKTQLISINVSPISYNFSGAAQNNTIFVNGSTPITFDVSEAAASETDYEIKYALNQGNAEIKNGSKTMMANQWETVNVGSFNRTFVGTTVGTVKILFTVRNKVSQVEKTQEINIAVIPSEFSFNATRANNDQVVNTQTNINFNLTQTGGASDTYNMTFSTSSTGTFTYSGTEYTAGQIIPFVIGASTGSYKGTQAGKHDLVFTVTNQINSSKKADVGITFINNDYTLSSSGDGTLYLNQTKDFSVFMAQLIPDPSISYEVKYSFDSGTTGNGIITQGGNPISLGSYQPIPLGSSFLIFKGTAGGNVNLLIEVKNSTGLLKSTLVMFQIKNTDFTFTGGAQSSKINVGESTPLNFDITEAVVSGTDYEMSYSVSSGSASIKNGSTTLNAYEWYTIDTGSFIRNLTPLSQGNSTLIFTVRNKITLQTKTVSVTVNAYQKPSAENIITSLYWFNRGGGKTDQYRFFFFANLIKDNTATIVSATLTFPDNGEFTGPYALGINQLSSINGKDRGSEWYYKADNSNNPRFYFDKKIYVLTIKDSNGYISTIEGIWHNNQYE